MGGKIGRARLFGQFGEGLQPALRCGRLLRQHDDIESLRAFDEACPEDAVSQRIGLRVFGQALNLRQHRRTTGLDIVMIPCDGCVGLFQYGIGFNKDRLAQRCRRMLHDVAGLKLRQFAAVCPPECKIRLRGQVRGHAHHGMMRIHPDPKFILNHDGARLQIQLLPERTFKNVGCEAQHHLADLDEPALFVPGIGLADEQMERTIRQRPYVESDLAVTERHGAVAVGAGRIPDYVVARRIRRGTAG